MKSHQNTLKACEARVKKMSDEMFARFKEWFDAPTQVGQSPIKLGEMRSPKSLRKWADSCIKRAVDMGKFLELSPQASDHTKLLHNAAISRAAAAAIEYEKGAADRQEQARHKAETKRIRREHEAASKIDRKRISELHETIKEAAQSERLLASIFKAYDAHTRAEAAREELQRTHWSAVNAARELGKTAPTVELPKDADADAKGMADILQRALTAQLR